MLLFQLVLLLEGLSHELALLPLVHAMHSLLVLPVQRGLLDDHLLVKVLLSLPDEHLSQTLLMLFNAEPLVVVDLGCGNFPLVLGVHVQDRLVDLAKLRLSHFLLELHFSLSLLVRNVAFQVGLSRLVEPLE